MDPVAPPAPSELNRLFNELARAHELISSLENRLAPISHGGIKAAEQKLATTANDAVRSESHISSAVNIAEAVGNRLGQIIENLAV